MNAAEKRFQIRGNCQCCGRDQAVVRGYMSKHGYQVKDGWFQGVCSGDRYAPMQVSRDQADRIIASVRAQVVELLQRAADYKAGKIVPQLASSYERDETGHTIMQPYASAQEWFQKDAVKSAIWECESRASAGKSFADSLERIANEYHGQALREVEIEAAMARIEPGERRQGWGERVLVARYQDGANVRYSYTASNGKEYGSKMGVQAWRRIPIAAEDKSASV